MSVPHLKNLMMIIRKTKLYLSLRKFISRNLSGSRVYSVNHEWLLFDLLPTSEDNTDYWDQEVCTNIQFTKEIDKIKDLKIQIKNIYHLA